MTIKAWGSGPLSISEIVAEFTDSEPHSMSEFYSGGTKVPASTNGMLGGVSTLIPTSSTIRIGHFYGATAALNLDILLIAGGGGGGAMNGQGGGGGGAGGFLESLNNAWTGGTITFTIGTGGTGGQTTSNGGNTTLTIGGVTLTAIGGGAGGSIGNGGYGQLGGSGGGGGGFLGGNQQGAGTSGQGFGGGDDWYSQAGSGGGAGASPPTPNGNAVGGAGKDWFDGIFYAGGGGGGSGYYATGSGGVGGGGNPDGLTPLNVITSAVPHSGSGGGGNVGLVAGDGGSGIVIFSYLGTPVKTGGIIYQSGGRTFHKFRAGGSFPSTTLTALSPSLSPATQTLSATKDTAISMTSRITPTDFEGYVTYSISPALPAGLTFYSSTGEIYGTPTAAQAATAHTITGTGGVSGTATSTFNLTVTAGTTLNSTNINGLESQIWEDSSTVGTTAQIKIILKANGNIEVRGDNDGLLYGPVAYATGTLSDVWVRTTNLSSVSNGPNGQIAVSDSWKQMGTTDVEIMTTWKDGAVAGDRLSTNRLQWSLDAGNNTDIDLNNVRIKASVAAAAGATFTSTGLTGLYVVAEAAGSGRTAGIDIIFKTDGTVRYQEVQFPSPDQLGGAGVWLASGSASGVSIRAQAVGTPTKQPTMSSPAGSSISGDSGWQLMTSDKLVANVECAPAGYNAYWESEFLIQFSNDGGATVASSYNVTIAGEQYV